MSDDYIIAERGKDYVATNPGNDVVFGGAADILDGHLGNDTI